MATLRKTFPLLTYFILSAAATVSAVIVVPANGQDIASANELQSRVKEFCQRRAISNEALHVAIAQIWVNLKAGDHGLGESKPRPRRVGIEREVQEGKSPAAENDTPSESGSSRGMPPVRQDSEVVDLYAHAWQMRIVDVDFELRGAWSGEGRWRLEVIDQVSHSTYDGCFSEQASAGRRAAKTLIEEALAEAHSVAVDPGNAKLSAREYMDKLTRYQAIRLIQYLLNGCDEEAMRKGR